MVYPTLNQNQSSREMIDVFRGYNHNLRISNGEFYEMKNLTSSYYPVLSPREKRGVYQSPYNIENGIVSDEIENPNGMISKDALCYVDGKDFIVNKYKVPDFLSAEGEKKLVSMGAYVIIMPDKKYINTLDLNDNGYIEAKKTINSGTLNYYPCNSNGKTYSIKVNSLSPNDGDYWYDSVAKALKRFSSSNGMWSTVSTTYVRLEASGIGEPFNVNDGVKISGLTKVENLNGTSVIVNKGDNYIVITGLIDSSIKTQSCDENNVTVSRNMPDMDFIVESGNRLWGCKYGLVDNKVVNEIYASKQGDFKNWNCFAGISTDSYVASCGTDGKWTGAVTHLGYPIFFKENCMHKVYGNYPAQYQIQTTSCRGVQNGCENSLAIVNEVLYYKARTGICAYDGSLPTEISDVLGDETYSYAVAGTLASKYYVSMQNDNTKEWNMFVYDTKKGFWHKEDNVRVKYFCSNRGNLYYIDGDSKHIFTVMSDENCKESEEVVKWMAETGVIGANMPDKKYISNLLIRMKLDIGAKVRFFIQYDSEGDFTHLFTMTGTTLRSFSVPIKARRCDHFRLRIEGEGDAKIFSVTKTIEQGSDI